jgi:hypothetical protein
VHFVLPDGWRGGFAIKPDDPLGFKLEKTEGRYVITIPESGVLWIKGHDPFGSYLNTAAFESGQAIWVKRAIDEKPGVGEVALWDVGTHVEDVDGRAISWYWWFVGTEDDWKASTYETRYRPGRIVSKDGK